MIHLSVITDTLVEGVVVKFEGKRAVGFTLLPQARGSVCACVRVKVIGHKFKKFCGYCTSDDPHHSSVMQKLCCHMRDRKHYRWSVDLTEVLTLCRCFVEQ